MKYQATEWYPRTVCEPAKNHSSGFRIPPRFYTLDVVEGKECLIPWPDVFSPDVFSPDKAQEANTSEANISEGSFIR